jgi:hypothetical protein
VAVSPRLTPSDAEVQVDKLLQSRLVPDGMVPLIFTRLRGCWFRGFKDGEASRNSENLLPAQDLRDVAMS